MSLQEQICRHGGLSDLDLTPLEAPKESIFYVMRHCPRATVADMSSAIAATLSKVEQALGPLRELQKELDGKVSDMPLAAEYTEDYRKYIENDEFPCGSDLNWLLLPALERYKKGHPEALVRYQRAEYLVSPMYLRDRMNGPGQPDSFFSETFDRYCDSLIDFVSGNIDSVGSYEEFLENAA